MIVMAMRKYAAPRRRPAVDYEGQEPAAVKLAYHVPNGGYRVKAVAARLKAQGVKAGVSDITLSMARGGYFGLYIEFKATLPHDAAVSPSQMAFLQAVEAQGYLVLVCRGFEAEGYMGLTCGLRLSRWPSAGRARARGSSGACFTRWPVPSGWFRRRQARRSMRISWCCSYGCA